jgi:ribonuclease D
VTFELVTDDTDVVSIVRSIVTSDRYALDTEFHRERTYYPRLALVQIAWNDDIVLIDPTRVDVKLLVPLLESDVLAVLHAAQQDLDVLRHACGTVPRRLFDTQLAAGFLGQSTPSLVNLVHSELGVQLPKGDRLTDWLRRPLTDDQLSYAAADVAHLLELHDRIGARLEELGRSEWAAEACEELRGRGGIVPDPADAWLRLKDARTLRPAARGVAKEVAHWREQRAMASDTPVRQVLPDLAVLGIAQRAPRTQSELAQARGVDDRHVRGGFGAEILAAVERGRNSPVELPHQEHDDLDRRLRPAVTLVSAWLSELARAERVDTTLLATRSDLIALLRGDEDARLRHGWRAELVGDDISRLLDGRAALTFDRTGGLRLMDLGT